MIKTFLATSLVLALIYSGKNREGNVPRSFNDTIPKYQKVIVTTLQPGEFNRVLYVLDSLFQDYGTDKLMSDVKHSKDLHTAYLNYIYQHSRMDSVLVSTPIPASVKEDKKQQKVKK